MDWLQISDILQLIGGSAGAIITIAGFFAAVTKRPKMWIQKTILEHTEPGLEKLEDKLTEEVGKRMDEITGIVQQKVDEIQTQMDAIQEQINEIQKKTETVQMANVCTLRHDITSIYETYRAEKKLPVLVHQDLCYLYHYYELEGGNSYVHDICEEMKDWEVIS